jgi:hypothetical protein
VGSAADLRIVADKKSGLLLSGASRFQLTIWKSASSGILLGGLGIEFFLGRDWKNISQRREDAKENLRGGLGSGEIA